MMSYLRPFARLRRLRAQSRSGAITLETFALFACMAIPVALSYFFFMGQSLRLDEAQSLWQTSRAFGDIFTVIAGDVHVPLYHLMLRLWRLYVGAGIDPARALSLALYVLSIPALYLVGSLAYDRRVALFAAFLFSVSPFMNWYGNEIRMYTLFTFFVILNQYFFIRIFKDREPNDNSWAGYTITALLGVFTHYFFFLDLAAQVVFYFLRQDLFPAGSFKKFVLSAALVIASFAPWLWYVLRLGTAGFQEPILAVPSSVDLFNAFGQFLYGFQIDNINTFFLSLWPVIIILGLVSMQRGRKVTPETEYFLTTVLVSFAIAFLASYAIAPVFVSRYLIFTIPSFYLLLASLFANYSPKLRSAAEWALALLLAAGLFLEIANPTMPVKENYEQAVDYMSSHVTAQDSVILSAPFTIYPVQYYYKGTAPISTLPVWNQYAFGPIPGFNKDQLPQQAQADVGSSQNIYLLLSYNQGYEASIKSYFDSHYQLIYRENFSEDLDLYVYKARYDTNSSAIATAFK